MSVQTECALRVWVDCGGWNLLRVATYSTECDAAGEDEEIRWEASDDSGTYRACWETDVVSEGISIVRSFRYANRGMDGQQLAILSNNAADAGSL